MRINNNIAALNTHRQLSFNNSNVGNSLEKLSSGLRINRAGDDAAGLAISEKMRGQIRGLEMASKNSQDGISLIQTAEGALNESHSILQRMRELAVQSASDTNTDSDRLELQKEVDQLAQELTRIANDTEFNQRTLLNGAIQEGNSGELTFHIGANAGQNLSLGIQALDASSLGVATTATTTTFSTDNDNISDVSVGSSSGTAIVDGANITVTLTTEAVEAVQGQYVFDGAGLDLSEDIAIAIDADTTITIDGEDASDLADLARLLNADDDFNSKYIAEVSGDTLVLTQLEGQETDVALTLTNDGAVTATDSTAGVVGVEAQVTLSNGNASLDQTFTLSDGNSNVFGEGVFSGISFTLNDLSQDAGDVIGTISISQETVVPSAATFNPDGTVNEKATAAAGVDISTQGAADEAITTIQSAIEYVSAERSKLGAVQNRLEHTINNLGAASENLTAAESRIRDVDMAKEMMEFTKNNILTQAAQAMLAQANQQPQGVLQLLR